LIYDIFQKIFTLKFGLFDTFVSFSGLLTTAVTE
jgi:hypothetical protein